MNLDHLIGEQVVLIVNSEITLSGKLSEYRPHYFYVTDLKHEKYRHWSFHDRHIIEIDGHTLIREAYYEEL